MRWLQTRWTALALVVLTSGCLLPQPDTPLVPPPFTNGTAVMAPQTDQKATPAEGAGTTTATPRRTTPVPTATPPADPAASPSPGASASPSPSPSPSPSGSPANEVTGPIR